MEVQFVNGEDIICLRFFWKFKLWIQRLFYCEFENVFIYLFMGKIVVLKERFVDIIVVNYCNEIGGYLIVYVIMRKV